MTENNENNQATNASLRAIVFATSVRESKDYAADRAVCMMPVADRSALHHAIETCVKLGASEVDLVISDGAAEIEQFVGDGTRWGISLKTRLVIDDRCPYAILGRQRSSLTLILHADEFPADVERDVISADTPVAFFHKAQWTGAAILTPDVVFDKAAELSREQLSEKIQSDSDQGDWQRQVVAPLSVRSGDRLLESQERILQGEFPTLMQHLRSGEPGIWIGRNARLHPTAKITGPALIGSNCEVGRRAAIGPNAVISDGSIVSQRVTVTNSIVLPSSSIGDDLELCDVIVAGTNLYNVRFQAAIKLDDSRLFADLSSHSIRDGLAVIASRIGGAFLIAVIWPPMAVAFVCMKLLGKSLRHERYELVQTPAPDHSFLWQTVSLRRLTTGRTWRHVNPAALAMWRDVFARIIPGLSAVIKGRIRLVGLTGRSAEELGRVSDHWRPMVLHHPAGLISESLIQYGPDADEDQCSVADVYYAVSVGRMRRVRLLARYVRTLVLGPESAGGRGRVDVDLLPVSSRVQEIDSEKSEVSDVGTI